MKILGALKIKQEKPPVTIDVKSLKLGINSCSDYIVNKLADGRTKYVINKVCDHAGGRLVVKGDKAICPLHNWVLDLDTLTYQGTGICKKNMEYIVNTDGDIVVNNSSPYLYNPYKRQSDKTFKLRWINHASILIEVNGKTLLTDPWLIGPAFLNGWWLQNPSPSDAIEIMKNADYIYISHNHSDHLHEETLRHLPRNKQIITANFISKSSENSLRKLGFNNIVTPAFNDVIEIVEGFQFSILKSGDFRDDSGIYINANGSEILLTVDSNMLNKNVLPKEIDILMSSFAGGASGYPFSYQNISEEEKLSMRTRSLTGIKAMISKYLKVTSPKNYMPYAGMFEEKAERDAYIREINLKNDLEDIKTLTDKYDVNLITPQQSVMINGTAQGIEEESFALDYVKESVPSEYISNLKENYLYDTDKIIKYFKECTFVDNQIVQLVPTNDNFDEITGDILSVDFSCNTTRIIIEEELLRKRDGYKLMTLKIRPEVFMKVVECMLPWEEMTVGFQMRADRFPDEYEARFWYYFTNVYIEHPQEKIMSLLMNTKGEEAVL